jgi:hypothetical protein
MPPGLRTREAGGRIGFGGVAVKTLCPGLLIAASASLLAVASEANAVTAPLLRTRLESPPQLEEAYYYRGLYYPYRWHGHYYHYRYHGHYCNHRLYRSSSWYCR